VLRVRLLAIALASTFACAPAPGPAPAATPIAAARALPLASEVAVAGVVTVPTGALDAGFAVQDATGGIYVNAADSTVRYAVGERVRVRGTSMDNHGMRGIAPSVVERAGEARAPAPRDVRTGEVGEATEGWLVRVRGAVVGGVVDDRPYGWKVYVDDGSGRLLVFVGVATGIDVSRFITPGQRVQITGLSGQYDDHHEILPRGPADVVLLP
jgi:hypothetical protein